MALFLNFRKRCHRGWHGNVQAMGKAFPITAAKGLAALPGVGWKDVEGSSIFVKCAK